MKTYKSGIIALLIVLLAGSCETDFKIISDWEDITVVYGLLDQRDSVQYIKINKAFLGEGNALTFAQEYDSSNYSFPLNVWIEELNENGQLVDTIKFNPATTYKPEDAGAVFPTDSQTVYKANILQFYEIQYIIDYPDTIGIRKIWLNENNTYKLYIKGFADTSKVVFSESGLVKDFSITRPVPGSDDIKFVQYAAGPTTFRWEKAPNDDGDFKYELELKFNYEEVIRINQTTSDTIQKTLTLAGGSVYLQTGNSELFYYYSNNNFYTSCLTQIPYADAAAEAKVIERHALSVDIIVNAAAAEFNLFMQVYQPSTSIVQEKPPYTNIENGIGVFSARYRVQESKKLHSETLVDLMEQNNNILKFDEY